jgi:hypothetical protein
MALAHLFLLTALFSEVEVDQRQEFDFKSGKAPAGVHWSSDLALAQAGLVLNTVPRPRHFTDFSIETDKIALGLSWRVPTGAKFTVSLNGKKTGTPYVYYRYGCDGVHWSTWYQMTQANKSEFSAEVRLPRAARYVYDRLWAQWNRTSPEWQDDEDALCRWIAKHDPHFFEREFPFLGYVQFRLEWDLIEDRFAIETLTIDENWSVGGAVSGHPPLERIEGGIHDRWHFEQGHSPTVR